MSLLIYYKHHEAINGRLAQLVRASGLHPECREFDPLTVQLESLSKKLERLFLCVFIFDGLSKSSCRRVRLWSSGEVCFNKRSQRPEPRGLRGEDLERWRTTEQPAADKKCVCRTCGNLEQFLAFFVCRNAQIFKIFI